MRNVAAIDPHTHIYPEGFIRDLRAGRFGRTAAIETDAEGEWIITRGRVLGRETELRNRLTPLYYELEPRFADMERMGVSRQVLSVGPAMTLYALEAEANRELAASLNDGLSALARAHPTGSPAWPRFPFRCRRPRRRSSPARGRTGTWA